MAEGAAVVAQMIAEATKACGTIVKVEPEVFAQLLTKTENPLVILFRGRSDFDKPPIPDEL